jgi:hypothetical protein
MWQDVCYAVQAVGFTLLAGMMSWIVVSISRSSRILREECMRIITFRSQLEVGANNRHRPRATLSVPGMKP